MALRKSDGTYTEGEEERASLLLEVHFPDSEPIPTDAEIVATTNHSRNPCRADWVIANNIFTKQRLEWAINTFEPYKSPGVDGIHPALLQKGLGEIMPHLLRISRSSLARGQIPNIWRRAKVTFIPKIGKKDGTDPKSF